MYTPWLCYLLTYSSMERWVVTLNGKDISESSLHIWFNNLGAAGSQINTPALQVGDTASSCTPFCDTATVVSYLWRTHLWDFCILLWKICQICQVWETHLLVQHILSRMNVLAGSLSRSKPFNFYKMAILFKQIFNLLPTLYIDLFVTHCNAQLSHFLSSFPDISMKE